MLAVILIQAVILIFITYGVHVQKAKCLLYSTLKYYVESIHNINLCSLWNLATVQPLLRDRCCTALRIVCTYNITNRGQRCNLCESDTPEHIITMCVYFSQCREDFIQSVEKQLGHMPEMGLMHFILDGKTQVESQLTFLAI